jgi:hypothetical protein
LDVAETITIAGQLGIDCKVRETKTRRTRMIPISARAAAEVATDPRNERA